MTNYFYCVFNKNISPKLCLKVTKNFNVKITIINIFNAFYFKIYLDKIRIKCF